MTPPTLTTSRLTIRPFMPDDLTDVCAMWNDPEVTKHIGNRTRDLQDTWFKMARDLGMWSLCGYGYWAVSERETNAFVGEIGFADFKRGLDPDISVWPEAGWVFARAAWGKGYATEALTAAHSWMDSTYPGAETCCIIEQGHTPSERVAAKLGYAVWKKTQFKDDTVTIFRRPAPT